MSEDRDLALFFSRLTATLDQVLGAGALAGRLAELRRNGSGSKPRPAAPDADPAFERAFRRLGFAVSAGAGSGFLSELAERVGRAAYRPAANIRLLLELFAKGDGKAGMPPVCGPTPNCLACLLTPECDYFNQPRKPPAAQLSPAERLLADRAAALSDAELVSLLMFGGRATGREEAVAAVFSRYGGLADIFQADRREYSGLRGMEKTPALRLAAAAELHARLLAGPRDGKLRLASAADIYHRYAAELRQAGGGTALLLLLDAANRVGRVVALDRARPAPADILRPALREGAARLALLLDGQSGTPAPDVADLDFVRRLRAASDIVGPPLLDCVVAGENGYYSFAEAGTLG
ncbi:MAG: hypothetical protein LBU23_10150 [Planctomycetota bacterium]|nr:hypothetical protein [Planctomycetota bacterium]